MRSGPAGRPLVLLLIVAAALAGCGKKGPPVAPERRLPAAPAGLGAIIEGPTVVLSWTSPRQRLDATPLRDLSVLRLHRRDEPGSGEPRAAMLSRGRVVGYDEIAAIRLEAPAPAEITGGTVRWVDRSGLVPGRRYVYVVTAVDATGRSSPPSDRLVVEFAAAPGAPRDLAASPGDGSVALRWRAPEALIDGSPLAGEGIGYLVLRGAGAEGALAPITPAPIPTPEFTDTGLDNDAGYRYAVRAVRVGPGGTRAFGEPSGPVTATPVDTTPPAAPTALVAIPAGGAVRLAWNGSPDADVTLYAVHRATERGDFIRIGTTLAPTTVFVDRGVTAGVLYRYVVTALDRARTPNESARSNEATARAE